MIRAFRLGGARCRAHAHARDAFAELGRTFRAALTLSDSKTLSQNVGLTLRVECGLDFLNRVHDLDGHTAHLQQPTAELHRVQVASSRTGLEGTCKKGFF